MNMDTPMLAELYTQEACLKRAGYQGDEFVHFMEAGAILDGEFTPEQLRQVATAYEEWLERSPEAKP